MGNRASFENFDACFADLERETVTLHDALLEMTAPGSSGSRIN